MSTEAEAPERAVYDVATDAPPLDSPAAPGRDKPSFVVRLLSVFLPVLVCLGGIGFAGMMVATRPEAARTAAEARGIPVRVIEATAITSPIRVHAQGQVRAAREVRLQPEVAGRVVWINDHLIPGGLVASGERLLRIDTRDYQAALAAQRAQLANSELSISQENSRRVIAEREWALLGREGGGGTPDGRDLALREPQVRSAQAQLRAAQAAVSQASTNLQRTTVTAPFDALVQVEAVDVGQLVTQGSQIATLVGTESFWVQVSIPMEQLAWIDVPRGEEATGSAATVTQIVGERGEIVRTGRVVRLLGDLDPMGRMARVLVEIDDPLGLARQDSEPGDVSTLPMLIGAFVRVDIDAGQISDVVEIPRGALHAGDVVYLKGEDDRLHVSPVQVVWRREDTVLVRGIDPGAQIIVSAVTPAVEGTLLRRIEGEEAPPVAGVEDEAPE